MAVVWVNVAPVLFCLKVKQSVAALCQCLPQKARKLKLLKVLRRAVNPPKVQKAWVDNQVPQCGYCQSGMVMATTALLRNNPKPTDAQIDESITNICRCGTFQQVRAAIHAASKA
jgi:isoquinoline 1-oxidoreductase alpha subunit